VANISVEGGTLVDEQRKKVVETIAAVNEGNPSVRGGSLVMKRIGEAVDVIQGGIQAMEQPQPQPEPERTPFDPDRQFSQSFREGITPPELIEPMTMEKVTDQPIPERTDVKVKELPDAAAASGVRPTNGKDIKPTEMREGVFSSAVESGWNTISEGLGINRETWDIFKEEIAKLESKGSGDYQAIGGDKDNYDGKYQMGRMAKADAGSLLGIDINHDEESRYNFRQNPALQERAFAAYTLRNHQYMMSDPIYQNLSPAQQITVLAYAHNQGHGGAKAFFFFFLVRKDAFGTEATKYSDALSNRLSVSLPEPPTPVGKTISKSLRPKVRPEQ